MPGVQLPAAPTAFRARKTIGGSLIPTGRPLARSPRALRLRTHLVDLAEGSVPQLAHHLPHLAGVQIAADVLVLLGAALLEGGKAKDAAEICESHVPPAPPAPVPEAPAAAPPCGAGSPAAPRSR